MRNKTPLALMEQTIMVLVFALAAALCLWVFVWSDQSSKATEARDQAAVAAQGAAEAIKHAGESGGDAEAVLEATAAELGGTYDAQAGELVVGYDDGWNGSGGTDGASFVLYARPAETDLKGLGEAEVEVVDATSGEPVFTIPVAWQTGVSS